MHEFFYSRDPQHAIDQAAAQPGTTLFALGLWIRLGFTGVSVFIAALVSLADGGTHAGVALSLALAGALLAAVAWLRVRGALREDEARARITQRAIAVNY